MLSIPTSALPVSGRGYHLSPRHREHPLISTLLNRMQSYNFFGNLRHKSNKIMTLLQKFLSSSDNYFLIITKNIIFAEEKKGAYL